MTEENPVIVVPNFKTIDEFKSWSETLSDKEIQSWCAKDWNKMYEKLFHFIEHSSELKNNIPELIENGTIKLSEDQTLQNLPYETALKCQYIAFMNNLPSVLGLSKLYRNYRPEPEQKKIIEKRARSAGRQASRSKALDTATLAWSENNRDADDCSFIYFYMNNVASIVSQQSRVTKENSIKKHWYSVDEISDGSYLGATNGHKFDLDSSRIASLGRIDSLFHEAAHAFLQYVTKINGKVIKPIFKLDDDFYKLLANNEKLYFLNSNENAMIIEQNKDKILENHSQEEYSKLLEIAKHKDYKSYQWQPLEFFAFFYGFVAARAFRKESNQYLENNIFLSNLLGFADEKLQEPDEVCFDDKGNLKLSYYSINFCGCHDENDLLIFLNSLFNGENNPMNGRFNATKNPEFGIDIIISNSYSIKEKLWQWTDKIWQPIYDSARDLMDKFCYEGYSDSVCLLKNGGIKFRYEMEDIGYTSDQLNKKLEKVLDKKTYQSFHFYTGENDSVIIKTPPKNSPEYKKLIDIFSKDEGGWLDAEKKRDIEKLKQKRLKFIRQAKMKKNIAHFLGINTRK